MSQVPQEEPFSEAHLDSPEYRERLMRKLNCLIAVLEVATAKVKRSLSEPEADTERLTRICANLQSTLDVCLRARTALERRESLPKSLPANVAKAVRESAPKPRARRGKPARTRPRADERSVAEMSRLAKLAPIEPRMIRECDLDELARKLQG